MTKNLPSWLKEWQRFKCARAQSPSATSTHRDLSKYFLQRVEKEIKKDALLEKP